MKIQFSLLTVVTLALFPFLALADNYKLGNLEIMDPYTRPTPPAAPVSGGYMVIRNAGTEDDVLVGGSAVFAGKVEVHEMKMDGDIMKMRKLDGGLTIPAGGEVTLKPGGMHIMFMHLKEQILKGEKYTATLEFEKAGSIVVEFSAGRPGMQDDAHSKKHSHNQGQKHGMSGNNEQIEALLKAEFDREDAPLTVEPIVVADGWAVAGWMQDSAGGRALLKKDGHHWIVLMCAGEQFCHADNLAATGMPHMTAMSISKQRSEKEAALGPAFGAKTDYDR